MAPRAAVRLLVQPGRGVTVSQLGPRTRYHQRGTLQFNSSGHSICFRCSLHASLRFYSTTNSSKTSSSLGQGPDGSNSNPTGASPSSSSSSSSSSTPTEGSKAADASASGPSAPAAAELPSQTKGRRHPLSARFSTFMDRLQTRALVAGRRLNDLTGYSAIESIKAENAALERAQQAAQARLRAARAAYKSRTERRAATQREVTTLLARKDAWAPADLERFTTLYRQDHELEAAVAAAAEELTEAEVEEGKLSAALNAGILKRYHEEQIWSDRIRQQSTWGTWGLMGVNVLLFLVLQFVAEPWKRRRLMRGVAEREKALLDEVRHELGEVRAALEVAAASQGRNGEDDADRVVAAEAVEEFTDAVPAPELHLSSSSWRETLSHPSTWGTAVMDLYSERRVDLRMRDASLLALEGAVTGAAVAVGIAIMLLRKS